MFSLNKAMIIGNATKDPEVKYTSSGQAVCNFSVATNRRYKNSNGDLVEDAQFHDIVAWGKVGEIISQIIKKGNKLYIEGRLQTRNWDAPDGSKRYRTEIVLEQFVPMAAGRSFGQETGPAEEVSAPADIEETTGKPPKKTEKSAKLTGEEKLADEEDINLDDIPF